MKTWTLSRLNALAKLYLDNPDDNTGALQLLEEAAQLEEVAALLNISPASLELLRRSNEQNPGAHFARFITQLLKQRRAKAKRVHPRVSVAWQQLERGWVRFVPSTLLAATDGVPPTTHVAIAEYGTVPVWALRSILKSVLALNPEVKVLCKRGRSVLSIRYKMEHGHGHFSLWVKKREKNERVKTSVVIPLQGAGHEEDEPALPA